LHRSWPLSAIAQVAGNAASALRIGNIYRFTVPALARNQHKFASDLRQAPVAQQSRPGGFARPKREENSNALGHSVGVYRCGMRCLSSTHFDYRNIREWRF
jgi:hypothetical protein